MKLTILGSCSGTEPMPGRHHASVALELADQLLWIDAGETCSYTGHLLGLDLLQIRHILISHPHMDHVGGLGNLLWTIRKLHGVRRYGQRQAPAEPPRDICVHLPNRLTFDGTMMVLKQTEANFKTDYAVEADEFTDGVIIDEPGLKVTAMHNTHLPKQPDQPWQSYSFLIEAEGKRIVYSGDLGGPEEVDCWADCALMTIETGHHQPAEVAAHFAAMDKRPKQLIYTHHGRAILFGEAAQLEKVQAVYGPAARFAFDGMTIEL